MKQQRAHSLLVIKAVDEDARIIEGVASTPVTDRAGDIVEPRGAQFSLPIPFLWQHESRESPIGHVVAAKVDDDGISVRVKVESDDEPGPLKDRLDYAWRAIKKGLVTGLSIGFKPIEAAEIQGSWGQRFTKWDWLELSAVTIPANADATIQTVKSLDAAHLAEVGRSAPPARSQGSVKLIQPQAQGGTVFDIQKQIQGYEATRAAKAAELVAIMEKSALAGETPDQEQTQRYDEVEVEIKSIDAHLKRLHDLEVLNASRAKPVDLTPKAPGQIAEPKPSQIVVKGPVELPQGTRFARVIKAIGQAHIKHRDVSMVARELFPDDAMVQKAAVTAGNTISGWASGLVGDETGVFADFVEFLRPQTILGKFGTNGIPDLRRVPFRMPLVTQTGGGAGYWVGEGKPKPLTSFNFTRTTLEPLKVANIAVLTEELLMSSSPAAEQIIRDQLVEALRERLDIDFIDPDKVASANVSPASITNGIVTIAAAGTGTADDIRTDVKALMGVFLDNDNPPNSGVWIMSAKQALAASLLTNALGQSEFEGITMNGGTLFGMPVITSEHVPTANYGPIIVLVNAKDIYLGDEGGFMVDVSREASLQMDSAPGTQDALTGTGTSLVSLWQTNSVGFRAERIINWMRRRTGSVAIIKDASWG